jgi:hypothetical protein
MERDCREIGKIFSPDCCNGTEVLSWLAFRLVTASPDTDVSQEQSSGPFPTSVLIYRYCHDQYRHTTNSTHLCFSFSSNICVQYLVTECAVIKQNNFESLKDPAVTHETQKIQKTYIESKSDLMCCANVLPNGWV